MDHNQRFSDEDFQVVKRILFMSDKRLYRMANFGMFAGGLICLVPWFWLSLKIGMPVRVMFSVVPLALSLLCIPIMSWENRLLIAKIVELSQETPEQGQGASSVDIRRVKPISVDAVAFRCAAYTLLAVVLSMGLQPNPADGMLWLGCISISWTEVLRISNRRTFLRIIAILEETRKK